MTYLRVQSLTASVLGFAVFLPGPAREKRAPASGKSIILGPLNRHSSNSFGLGQGWRIFLRERGQTEDNYRSSSFVCVKLSEFRRQHYKELNTISGTSF